MRISALALGEEFKGSLVRAAAAIELLGMSACLLDDLVDETTFYDLKRTTWLKYGFKETIYAYEVLCSLATKALIDSCNESQIEAKDFEQILYMFENIKYDAYVSQFMDIRSERDQNFSEQDYFEIISRFPGTLYASALQIACLLSGVKDERLEALKEFGRLFGMANQIRDDLVEIIGDEEAIGKKIGADIMQKKKRLPLILFLQNNKGYTDLIQNSSLKSDLLNTILSKMKKDGIIDSCINVVRSLVDKALLSISSLSTNRWKDLLEDILFSLGKFEDELAKIKGHKQWPGMAE